MWELRFFQNKSLDQFSGKSLLSSIRHHLPAAGIIAYHDFLNPVSSAEIEYKWTSTIYLNGQVNHKQVLDNNKDIIPRAYGGDAIVDDCGTCGGDGSSCSVNVTFSVDMSIEGVVGDIKVRTSTINGEYSPSGWH